MPKPAPFPLAVAALLALLAGRPASAAPPAQPPADILKSAPAADWAEVPASSLLVMQLKGGGKVVIALADAFAPVHTDNMRRLARAHWWDGLAVERVQDDYVTQWGDANGKKPLPADVVAKPPAEYERALASLPLVASPYTDTYAPKVGVVGAFPVASDGRQAWLAHCYGMVGVGRDLNPDTGTGAELYAVIGQPIRPLDRNIAVVGRVLEGMEALSALPRGTGDLGFYTDPKQRPPIESVRLASDLPAAEQPHLQTLRPESASYRAWVHARANRQDSFFLRPAGAADLCTLLPPVRAAP